MVKINHQVYMSHKFKYELSLRDILKSINFIYKEYKVTGNVFHQIYIYFIVLMKY